MAQWRRFSFFEKELLKDPVNNNIPWMRGVNVTCATSNRGMVVFGDAEGSVHMADRQLEVRKFQAHDHFVSHAVMLKKMNVLVTVGDGIDPRDEETIAQSKKLASKKNKKDDLVVMPVKDVSKSSACVRLWRTDQQDRDGKPKNLQQIRIFTKYPEEAVTAFSVSEDLSNIAVGLKNGAVILFRSDLKRRSERPPVLLQPAAQYPVTGLAFTEKPSGEIFLYAVTLRGLTCYLCNTSGGSSSTAHQQQQRLLDERGVDFNCSVINGEGEMVVGQSDAVYFYTTEDRSICFGFEGTKKYLTFFKHYLLVAHVDLRGRHQINVYDLTNKFIAFNWTLFNEETIRHVVCEFGAIFIVSCLGHVYRLTEKDTASKLEILFRKNLYSIAISLAFSSNYDTSNIMDIFRMYGDHLYEKGDYDGSIAQYIRTIGHVEPSYVIRRFLDAQRIFNLTTFLEKLHEKAFANAEHTILLLNCYTKLKDVSKLDRFISTSSIENNITDKKKIEQKEAEGSANQANGANKERPVLTFDVETAISVLQAHYPQHALQLAKKHHEHNWYLKIQLDEISYISDSSESTCVLNEGDRNRVADSLAYIETLDFDEAEAQLKKHGRTLVTHLPEETTQVLKNLCTGAFSPLHKSDPAEFLHLYLAHPHHLKQFLEYIVQVTTSVTNRNLGNTLLEMYLQEETDDEDKKEANVIQLLDNPRVQYDEDHALILVQMHDMKRGQRYLYKKLHMYHMLVQHHIEAGENQRVIEEVKMHGETEPNLYLLALKYFTEKGPNPTSKQWPELMQILDLIGTKAIPIPPLQVVQVLSQAKNLPLEVVRPYLLMQLKSETKKIQEHQEEVEKFTSDTEKMNKELSNMASKAVVFQATKCDLCNHELDLPAVHFMCQHSFHHHCIPEMERECIVCAPEHRHVVTLRTSLQQKAANHELFYNQLETAADGFSTVAEYFGKGIFKPADPEHDRLHSSSIDEGRFSNEF